MHLIKWGAHIHNGVFLFDQIVDKAIKFSEEKQMQLDLKNYHAIKRNWVLERSIEVFQVLIFGGFLYVALILFFSL